MKKVFYIAAAAALGLMSSCTEELDQKVPTGLAPDGKFYIDVTVTNPSADTRTVFDPATYEVSWLDTDEIGAVIFDGTDYTLHKFTKGESGNKFGTETFTPVAGTEYTWYLLYPYDEEFMVADGKTVTPVVNITSGSQSEAGDAGHVDTPCHLLRLCGKESDPTQREQDNMWEPANHYPKISIARSMRLIVSSLPMISVMSNIWGPLHSPTTARRKAFITLPKW